MKEARRSFLLEPPAEPLPAAQAFLRHARFRLREDYSVKINSALAELSDEQIWWRPNEASNSAGNLILHLCGNVRQWMIAGVSGVSDTRDRDREFAERCQLGKQELLALLTTTLSEVTQFSSDWKTKLRLRNPTLHCSESACRRDLLRQWRTLSFTLLNISVTTPARLSSSPSCWRLNGFVFTTTDNWTSGGKSDACLACTYGLNYVPLLP